MEKITFKELRVKWDTLCEKMFEPLRIKDEFIEKDPKKVKVLIKKMNKKWKEIFEKPNLPDSKYTLFIQQFNAEWDIILNQSGWARLEELQALSEWSVTSRIMYSQLEHGDRN
jgi:hypothetical protein